ncbi:YdeI/OmpD-associated family protein [Qipengyuania huizhouensis]|uniref:YdeI/OmpD-associated family protein n=1 Tax=Qipengyuania huizhouensis TaxID=2867245 RepID=UPI001C86B469|nr:YdeI/OmpD-associated family protein [Qipengyuania huizhouensis]MBX7461563.1 YdeI/OmpD-associated family protein [Qipengyuania huizhouensis]
MAKAADPDFRHDTPHEIKALLESDQALSEKWQALTPLARNEWICWAISAKQEATREKRRVRLHEEVLDGKKRPCCWPGCPHRRESARKWVDA